jgi:putative endonuclease
MYFVYILTNKRHTVLYTGFTNDLERRVYEHKHAVYVGFTSKYKCNKLVYFEDWVDIQDAVYREKQLKKYRRKWKENLISSMNPQWRDLYIDFLN